MLFEDQKESNEKALPIFFFSFQVDGEWEMYSYKRIEIIINYLILSFIT